MDKVEQKNETPEQKEQRYFAVACGICGIQLPDPSMPELLMRLVDLARKKKDKLSINDVQALQSELKKKYQPAAKANG